ncbi:MAG: peptidase S10, partial [Rubrivivax sp.]|nr:peptidase S10 [Rubrivivax sp.]
MADAAAPASPDTEAAKRSKERFDKLLATPAANSTGKVTLGGRTFDYDVQAAFVPVAPGGLGEPEAVIMTTAYLLKGASAAQRPVCFAFNGGPGSASIWLHLGALGPKRVVVPDDGSMPQAPYGVEDNPHSWFEHFDLVFIDPPHTGWSLTASEAARKKMLSVDGDIDALAEVMRLWLTR